MIKLDGSFGEGGGAILRQALALSTFTGKPFEIVNIRKGRPVPGLKAQHIHSIIALEKISDCNVTGCEKGSERLTFIPGDIKSRSVKVDVGTAGSITLLLQSLLLPCLFSGKRVSLNITGGTDVKWSQPIDYLANVLVPHLKRFGEIEVHMMKRGYYPKGGGRVVIKVKDGSGVDDVKEFDLMKKGELLCIRGVSHASLDLERASVAERQSRTADVLLSHLHVPVSIMNEYSSTFSPGSGVCLWALFGKGEYDFARPVVLGADALGARGKKSEDVGKEAVNALLKEINSEAVVDRFLADQLVPYLALTGGSIKTSKITNHTHSNIYVAEKFLNVKFEIKNNVISVQKV